MIGISHANFAVQNVMMRAVGKDFVKITQYSAKDGSKKSSISFCRQVEEGVYKELKSKSKVFTKGNRLITVNGASRDNNTIVNYENKYNPQGKLSFSRRDINDAESSIRLETKNSYSHGLVKTQTISNVDLNDSTKSTNMTKTFFYTPDNKPLAIRVKGNYLPGQVVDKRVNIGGVELSQGALLNFSV